MIQYMNGNVSVTLLDDGTKIRECDGIPMVQHPESLDVKITNYCTDVCAYCHEQSTPKGTHANIHELLNVLQTLPAGVEIALGGGNPLSHPNLELFLRELKRHGLIASITVNQKHLDVPFYFELLINLIDQSLVNGVGISITGDDMSQVRIIQCMTPHVVHHVIAGINPIRSLDRIVADEKDSVLILGYKQVGRGIEFFSDDVQDNLQEWRMHISKFFGKFQMSFDNLALSQLSMKRFFSDKMWNGIYMGDEFTSSMYVDAVRKEFAPSSTSIERVSWCQCSLLEYFEKNHH